jgi:hypothetical protein
MHFVVVEQHVIDDDEVQLMVDLVVELQLAVSVNDDGAKNVYKIHNNKFFFFETTKEE